MGSKEYDSGLNKFLLLAEEQSSAFIDNLKIEDTDSKSNAGLKFHISSDDYFGTLASVLHLLMDERLVYNARHKEVLKNIADDLAFLQKNYKIVRK